MISLRGLVPPAWRSIANGRPDPWLLIALAAGLAGAGWILSPAGAVEQVKDRVYGKARRPTELGRALGYSARGRVNPYVDPLGVLTNREQLELPAGGVPDYRAARVKPPVVPPKEFWAPIRTQDFRALAAAAPYRQPPAKPGVAITATDVLRPAVKP